MEQVRAIDVAQGGGFTALADIFFLCAFTRHWFYAERDYKASSGLQQLLPLLCLDSMNVDMCTRKAYCASCVCARLVFHESILDTVGTRTHRHTSHPEC